MEVEEGRRRKKRRKKVKAKKKMTMVVVIAVVVVIIIIKISVWLTSRFHCLVNKKPKEVWKELCGTVRGGQCCCK